MAMTSFERVGRVAVAWADARTEEQRLWDIRGACKCERAQLEGFYSDGDEPNTQHSEILVCWKREEWESDYTPTEPELWCAPCIERQRLHVLLLAATRRRAALQAGLMRSARSVQVPSRTREKVS